MLPAHESPRDPRFRAARLLQAKAAKQDGEEFDEEVQGTVDVPRFRRSDSVSERANSLIDRAVRNGDFDHLQYAGKPIPNLGSTLDPDWWLKGVIERERLTGLGPPAIMLRHEDAELEATIDEMFSAEQVRSHLKDFNRRVIETRRQLEGGPPVVTKTRDIEAEVSAWQERRKSREPESVAEQKRRGLFGRWFGAGE